MIAFNIALSFLHVIALKEVLYHHAECLIVIRKKGVHCNLPDRIRPNRIKRAI
jgi:hypothetical protein